MDLKDLASEEHLAASRPERAAALAATPEPTAKDSWPAGPPGVWWLVLESRLLGGEQILVVFEKKHLKGAQKAHPGKVIYFPPEIEELRRQKDVPDYAQFLKSVHLVKKKLGGWIVPSDSPLVRRFDPPKGGDNHGTAKHESKTG